MSLLRRGRLVTAGLMIALSLAAAAGLMARGQARVAVVCSFAEIEEGGCGVEDGAAG